MTDTNHRKSAGQLRRQLRIQRNRVVVPTTIGIMCIALVFAVFDNLSRFQVGVLLTFALYAFGSAAIDAKLWHEKRSRIAQLEQRAASPDAATGPTRVDDK